jgi:hypothetical protein
MGAALQEGYWAPDAYDDAGETIENETEAINFDEEMFSGETKPYYYASPEDYDNNNKSFYAAYELTDTMLSAADGHEREASIKMTNPILTAVMTVEEGVTPGWSYILIDATRYYSQEKISKSSSGDVWTLTFASGYPVLKIGEKEYIFLEKPYAKIEEYKYDCSKHFQRLSTNLFTYTIYPGAGFEYGFAQGANGVVPIVILSKENVPYDSYETYQFCIGQTMEELDTFVNLSTNAYLYPRIALKELNIKSESDNFRVEILGKGEEGVLEKFEDYTILSRGTTTYITLKTTKKNSFAAIKDGKYKITYQVSHANDMLYLDAKTVAKDNSQPKLSYSISIANTPDEIKEIKLGQLIFINDYSVDVRRAPGYVSGLTLKLDAPKEDEITIANYKTKFEDLFSTITASSEAMKNNKRSYDLASNAFIGGQLSGTVLQQALANATIALSFSQTNIDMTDSEGIILTNTSPYTNGVYG